MLDHTKPYIENIHYADAELSGHAYELDVKLQSLCGSCFLCFLCAFSCQALPLWSELTNNTLRKKDGVHFFILTLECHNSYNRLLLCNSANGDIAWWNKNNSEWGFCVFFTKRIKTCIISIKKKQIKRTWGLFLKIRFFLTLIIFQPFLWFSLDPTIWNKSCHYEFHWVCAHT